MQQIIPISTRILHSLLLLLGVTLAGIVLVLVLTVMQGQRDEARRVDAIVIPHLATLSPLHLDTAARLYQQGYAARLMVAGSDPAAARDQLVARNVPPDIILTPPEATNTRLASTRQLAALARANQFQSFLMVDQPDAMLLTLKLAGDNGMQAYGVPLTALQLDLPLLLQATLNYWQYALLGSTPPTPAAPPPPPPPAPPQGN